MSVPSVLEKEEFDLVRNLFVFLNNCDPSDTIE